MGKITERKATREEVDRELHLDPVQAVYHGLRERFVYSHGDEKRITWNSTQRKVMRDENDQLYANLYGRRRFVNVNALVCDYVGRDGSQKQRVILKFEAV